MKNLTKKAVKLALDLLIDANGQATTLEIKNQLRDLGYHAIQTDIHNFMEEIFTENKDAYARANSNEGYNVYTAVSDWEQIAQNSKTANTADLSDDNKLTDDLINKVNGNMADFHKQQNGSLIPGAKIAFKKDVDSEDESEDESEEEDDDDQSGTTSSTDDIRAPKFIYYTEKQLADSNQLPNDWIVSHKNGNNEIHVYSSKVTRDQARSRYASLLKTKVDVVRCRKAINM